MKNVEHDYVTNQRRSASNVSTRIRLHLLPYFGGWRMSAITTADIRACTTARLADHAQPASINRELAILKRAYSLAMKEGTLTSKPHIPMLEERNIRQGFFEADQLTAIQTHLPDCWRPVMTFAFYTGWRVRSEILPLTWAQVDERVQIVRLEAGTTKNTEGRTFPYGVLPNLLALLEAQGATRDALKAQGIICPWVFPDAQGRRLPAFYSKVWRQACREAGYPGKVPHDLRRSAVRNLVRAGVPEKTAMLLTGHKTRSVFDRYDIVNENDLRAAVTKLAVGSNMDQIQQPARVQQFKQPRS